MLLVASGRFRGNVFIVLFSIRLCTRILLAFDIFGNSFELAFLWMFDVCEKIRSGLSVLQKRDVDISKIRFTIILAEVN